jgi:hypothetical protein
MRGEGCESPSSGNSRPSLPDVSGVSLLTRKQFSSGTRSRVGGLRARPQCTGCPKGKALSEGGGNAVSFVTVPDGKRGDAGRASPAGRRHAAGQCRGVLVGRLVRWMLVRAAVGRVPVGPGGGAREARRIRSGPTERGGEGGSWFLGERSGCHPSEVRVSTMAAVHERVSGGESPPGRRNSPGTCVVRPVEICSTPDAKNRLGAFAGI